MKKKNLNFLLALLAALALVFAGACSDGSDDDTSAGGSGGYSYTSEYSGTTWTYEGTNIKTANSHTGPSASPGNTYLTSVGLSFADTGNTVAVTVTYQVCTYENTGNAHNSSYNDGWSDTYDTEYTATFDATYTALADRVGIELPAGADDDDTVTLLTFTYTAASGEGTTPTLTLAGENSGTSTAAYTVVAAEDTAATGAGIDLFTDSDNGGLAAGAVGTGSEFELPTSSDSGD